MNSEPSPTCLLCRAHKDVIGVQVDWRQSDRFALPQHAAVCADCLRLLAAGEDDALADRIKDEVFDEFGRHEVIRYLRERLSPRY